MINSYERYAVAVEKDGQDWFARHNLTEILYPDSVYLSNVTEYVKVAGHEQLCNQSPWYFQNYLSQNTEIAQAFADKLCELTGDDYRVVRLSVEVSEIGQA